MSAVVVGVDVVDVFADDSDNLAFVADGVTDVVVVVVVVVVSCLQGFVVTSSGRKTLEISNGIQLLILARAIVDSS